MCGGQINFLIKEAKWMCYTCGHEEPAKGETEGASSEPAATPDPAPVMEPPVALEDKPAPGAAPSDSSPSAKKPPLRKKACPICRKQMDWREREKSWHCPSCGYRKMEL